MAYSAFLYLTHDAKMVAAFDALGYPRYLLPFLGVAKSLGVIALLVPGFPRLKEWAYAGFTFDLLGAAWSHFSTNQMGALVMPLASLVLLIFSLACRPPSRKQTHETITGVQAH